MIDDADLYGDDEHPAAYHDDPTPILATDPDWSRVASYHLRRISECERRRDELTAAFTAEIERLEARLAAAIDPIARKIEWHRRPLIQLHEQLLAADPSRKTLTLPNGTIKSRTPVKPTVEIVDRDRFEEWAHTNAPHLLRVTFAPDKKAIDRAISNNDLVTTGNATEEPVHVVAPTGETIPGVQLRLGARTFSISTENDAS